MSSLICVQLASAIAGFGRSASQKAGWEELSGLLHHTMAQVTQHLGNKTLAHPGLGTGPWIRPLQLALKETTPF